MNAKYCFLKLHHNLTKTQSKMIPLDSVYICQNILTEKDIDASLHACLPLFGYDEMKGRVLLLELFSWVP